MLRRELSGITTEVVRRSFLIAETLQSSGLFKQRPCIAIHPHHILPAQRHNNLQILSPKTCIYTMDLPENHTLEYSPSPPGSPKSFASFGSQFVEGVFKPASYDDLEDPEQYMAGGLHPVHLGDLLGNSNQYKVIHKLGSGGFATVWLCRDLEKDVYTALKIMIADASKDDCVELKLLKKTWDMEQVGGKQIAIPRDHFWIDGPNGHHLCLVLPVLGPRVSEIWNTFKDPSTLSRKIAPQVVHGLQILHSHNVCHGGQFTPITSEVIGI